jgi:hypothetical protein
MKTRAELLATRPRVTALAAATILVTGCATLHPAAGQRGAVETALQGVCGAPHAPADSSCVVRDVARVSHGYRVVIDRRPPAGNDRVAVVVKPAGVIGGSRIEVTQIDTTAGKP